MAQQEQSITDNAGFRTKKLVENLLQGTEISINGSQAWDVQVKNPRFYSRVLRKGSLGLGESYMEGWWECERIDELIYRLLKKGLASQSENFWQWFLYRLQTAAINLQSKSRAFIVGKKHYDLGNDLFEKMLDPNMCYSCAYWKQAQDLESAQVAKMDLAAQKLELKPGMKVLDIGCGWGSFAYHAAKYYGCEVTGITISKEQAQYAQNRCQTLPVSIVLEDYRKLTGQFDRIISIGIFEHVGLKNYQTYFKTIKSLLKSNGLFLLHTIGKNLSEVDIEPWINTYIFPNYFVQSIPQLMKAAESFFIMEDWQNFGPDYDHTLLAWHERFEAAWPELAHRYNAQTYRMFRYYLLSCAGAFRARNLQLWQVVFSQGLNKRYDAAR